ncbi:MAG: RdgB/HAM1 family non-canonical purine NTP pyrophosphatase, partial [Saprospiraceae bacterium]
QKARYVYDNYGMNCFAEDTGLEITALNMEPGVDTAMYAGEARDADANMAKVLKNLNDKEDRSARFKTVIAYIKDGEVETFEGIVNGTIATEKTGEKGFGYDPIFRPEKEGRTFAEMTDTEKNQMSHRARAMAKFMVFLFR